MATAQAKKCQLPLPECWGWPEPALEAEAHAFPEVTHEMGFSLLQKRRQAYTAMFASPKKSKCVDYDYCFTCGVK